MIDKSGESAEDVVRREAEEEAGLKIGRCTFALSYLSSGRDVRADVCVYRRGRYHSGGRGSRAGAGE